jgi:hypothetical protein
MSAEQLTPTQAHEIVQELREADYRKAGNSFFADRNARLNAAGWVLGVFAYRQAVVKGRRGFRLKHPLYEWRAIAHWYHPKLGLMIWYWNNFSYNKYAAELYAKANPVPFGTFTVYNKQPIHDPQ